MDIRRPIRASILAKLTIFAAIFSLVPLYLLAAFFIILHNEFLWYGLSALFVLTILVLGGAYIFAGHLTRPILALKRGVERIAKGDFSTFVEVVTTMSCRTWPRPSME